MNTLRPYAYPTITLCVGHTLRPYAPIYIGAGSVGSRGKWANTVNVFQFAIPRRDAMPMPTKPRQCPTRYYAMGQRASTRQRARNDPRTTRQKDDPGGGESKYRTCKPRLQVVKLAINSVSFRPPPFRVKSCAPKTTSSTANHNNHE